LKPEQKEPAGNLVHYVFGTAVGGLYGLLAEKAPHTRAGFGTLYGTAVWLGADEVALPLLGLSKAPRHYPWSTHASALASHLVYGSTMELVRLASRRAMRYI